MSIIHVQQIKAHLSKIYDGLIDLSDIESASNSQKGKGFLTRSLAAYSIKHLAGLSEDLSATCVIDGSGDNGIDAVCFDGDERTLFLVQAKWHEDGHGSITRGDLSSFVKGFYDLLNLRFDRFNAKIKGKETAIQQAVHDANTKFVLVIAHTGVESLSVEVSRDLEDALGDLNNPVEIVTSRVLDQASIHTAIAQDLHGEPIRIEAMLYNWGQAATPYQAYYGQVSASDLAEWYRLHYPQIFAPNIRNFLGSTEVNSGIIDTATIDPDLFWYFNNGITVLCNRIAKRPIGGNRTDTGIFECEGVSIVNGAQTVGSLASAWSQRAEQVGRARVPIRLISLEGCPPGFANRITRATNTQNRIGSRDFAVFDPNQSRLSDELRIDGITYAYKSGDTVPAGMPGFSFEEAMTALACSQIDLGIAVQAKREVSKLWEDFQKVPYVQLVNPGLTGRRLWRIVDIQRTIDAQLRANTNRLQGRPSMVPIHGNRLLAYLIWRNIDVSSLSAAVVDIEPIKQAVPTLAARITDTVVDVVESEYPDSYLASLFKNSEKCKQIATLVMDRLPP